jgi:mono/diheme cytochrome c family protein
MRWFVAVLCAASAFAQSKIWDGVYTAAQAERGKAAYAKSCTNCHIADLAGSVRGPSLKGDRFMAAWQNTTVNNLFRKIRDSMPATYPETVADDVKIDIIAYLLQQNGFPAGSAELTQDSNQLENIQIARKGASGLPNFALVQVVGCLEPGPGKSWVLAKASEPALTKEDAPDASALAAATVQATGDGRILLVSAGGFDPAPNVSRKMEARGLLYRDSVESRINLTSLRPVAGSCQP